MTRVALAVLFVAILFIIPISTRADTVSELQAQIDENNRQVESLKKEIAAFQKQLNALGEKKSTLQSEINALTLSQKQLASQIKVSQNNISSANLKIKELSLSIGDKEESIENNRDAIAKALRGVAEEEDASFVIKFISADSLSDAWRSADQAVQFNRALKEEIATLREIRTQLADNRDAVAATKAKLVALQNELSTQKKSVEVSKAAQQRLLADTKNQESAYQRLVAQKRAQQTEFENQLYKYEQQLRQALDLSSIPSAHSGILAPPIAQSFITQFFGKTVDSIRLYVSGTHNGIDYRAAIGTPVKASLSGIVTDTESVKTRSGCQYGKWVLIKHANGLSTIYGHLSFVYVQKGQAVSTGELIGLSGDTGYATGPHLHFGVYATAGISVVDAGALGSIRCAGIKTVASPPNGYLNPLSYL